MKFVVVAVAGTSYALSADKVLSIEKMQFIRPIPLAESHILGVTNLRGVVICALDLRILLGQKAADETPDTRMIVIENTAYIVDEALDIVDVPADHIEPWEANNGLVNGVWRAADGLVLIMNEEALMAV